MTTDILIDLDTNDLKAKDGDFAIGDATEQNQKILLVSNKGEIKRYPTICVGSIEFLEDENQEDYIREIRKEFVNDEMTIDYLILTESKKVKVNAHYE